MRFKELFMEAMDVDLRHPLLTTQRHSHVPGGANSHANSALPPSSQEKKVLAMSDCKTSWKRILSLPFNGPKGSFNFESEKEMAFVLERMIAPNKKKIIADADNDKSKLLLLTRDFDNEDEDDTRSWVIDKDADVYMFSAPVVTREDVSYRPYYVYFGGKLRTIRSEGDFSNCMVIEEASDLTSGEIESLKKNIIEAFAIYGRNGKGPLNARGEQEFAIHPQFKMKR